MGGVTHVVTRDPRPVGALRPVAEFEGLFAAPVRVLAVAVSAAAGCSWSGRRGRTRIRGHCWIRRSIPLARSCWRMARRRRRRKGSTARSRRTSRSGRTRCHRRAAVACRIPGRPRHLRPRVAGARGRRPRRRSVRANSLHSAPSPFPPGATTSSWSTDRRAVAALGSRGVAGRAPAGGGGRWHRAAVRGRPR